jgi:hypothetical protein
MTQAEMIGLPNKRLEQSNALWQNGARSQLKRRFCGHNTSRGTTVKRARTRGERWAAYVARQCQRNDVYPIAWVIFALVSAASATGQGRSTTVTAGMVIIPNATLLLFWWQNRQLAKLLDRQDEELERLSGLAAKSARPLVSDCVRVGNAVDEPDADEEGLGG